MKTKAIFLTLMAIMAFGINVTSGMDVYDLESSDPYLPNLYQRIIIAKPFTDITSFTEKYYPGDKVRFQPILLNINIPPGMVKCYAAYVEGDKIYIARQISNNIVFAPYNGEREIPYYEIESYQGGSWTPSAYYLGLGESLRVAGKTFIFGIAPVSVNSVDSFVKGFYGEWIRLTTTDYDDSASSWSTTPITIDTCIETGTCTDPITETTDCEDTEVLRCYFGGSTYANGVCADKTKLMSCQDYEKFLCSMGSGKWENSQCSGLTWQGREAYESLFCMFAGGHWSNGKCLKTN